MKCKMILCFVLMFMSYVISASHKAAPVKLQVCTRAQLLAQKQQNNINTIETIKQIVASSSYSDKDKMMLLKGLGYSREEAWQEIRGEDFVDSAR